VGPSFPIVKTTQFQRQLVTALIDLLQDLTYDELSLYPSAMKLDEVPRKYYTPIYKAVYLTQKYKDHESAVDCVLGHILSALGFNEGRLFSFPQMRSPLKYGEDIISLQWLISPFLMLSHSTVLALVKIKV
jgi:hypothetical protein